MPFPNKANLRPWMGQGRPGSRRRKPDLINQSINQPSDVTQGIQRGTQNSNRENKQHTRYKQHM